MDKPPDFSREDVRRGAGSAPQMTWGVQAGRPGGCLRSILASIGVLTLAVVFLVGFDYMVAPWAWGWFGRPTLTGEWVGTFLLPEGQRGAGYLNLTHNPNDDFKGSRQGRDLPPLAGTAQGCIGPGGIQVYGLSGGASSDGQEVRLSFSARKPTIANYAFQEMKGSWGGSTLTLSGTFTTILDTQGSTLLKSEPNQTQPTTIVFHAGGHADFVKACQTHGQ